MSSPPVSANRWSAGAGLYDPYDPTPQPPQHGRQSSLQPYTTPHASQANLHDLKEKPSRASLLPSSSSPSPAPLPRRRTIRRPSAWARAVKAGTWPRLLYLVSGLALIGLWVGLVLYFVHIEKARLQKGAQRDMDTYVEKYGSSYGDIDVRNWPMLRAALRGFDAEKKELKVQWQAATYSAETGEFAPMVGGPIGIYLDDAKPIYNPSDTDQNATSCWGWKLDNSTATRVAVLGVRDSDAMDTTIDMAAKEESRSDVWIQPSFGYPWDEWEGTITITSSFMWANDELQSFSYVSLADSIMNWKVKANSTDTYPSNEGCELIVDFHAERPSIVKFSVVVVVVINWIVTITVFLLTGESIFLRRAHILEGMDMLGVCFAALFALPTVRILLPGAPVQFGALIDFVGILPNIIIITSCTVLFALAKVAQRYVPTESEYKPI